MLASHCEDFKCKDNTFKLFVFYWKYFGCKATISIPYWYIIGTVFRNIGFTFTMCWGWVVWISTIDYFSVLGL